MLMQRKSWASCVSFVVLIVGVLVIGTASAQAQTFYVRAGASGSGGDWANAYSALPATLVRGATYYVAAGTYGGYTFDDPESGSSVITIKKASAADHGTNTGWQAAYANQATFNGSFQFQASYITIDGTYRSECTAASQLKTTTCWRSGYGFRFTAPDPFSIGIAFTTSERNITIAYVEAIGSGNPLGSDRGVRIALGSSYITISRSYIHDQGETNIHAFRTNNLTVEYTWIARNCKYPSHCEGIVANEGSSGLIVRYSIFEDLGSTAHIGTPTGGHPECGGAQQRDWYIYGNIFTVGAGTRTSGAGIVSIFDHNMSGDFFFHNNTIVGVDSAAVGGTTGPGQGCIAAFTARNNLFVDVGHDGLRNISTTASFVGTHNGYWNSPNSVSGTNTYSGSGQALGDWRSFDFSLTSTAASTMPAGFALGSPYNQDMFGNIRGADGKWDRGAIEFGGSGGSPTSGAPTAPSNLRIVSQ
jgi:hypothetical protein